MYMVPAANRDGAEDAGDEAKCDGSGVGSIEAVVSFLFVEVLGRVAFSVRNRRIRCGVCLSSLDGTHFPFDILPR